MRKIILLSLMSLLTLQISSQENMLSLSGGYSFANIDESSEKGTGWRINGLFEFNPSQGNFAHGLAVSYIALKAEETLANQTITRKVNSFPIYYAPKFMFGSEKIKGFVKGALGMQFAGLKREGPALNLEDNDFGFYGGGGGGFMILLGDKFFINAEYEIAWASNSWYDDGWIQTAMGGIGFKF